MLIEGEIGMQQVIIPVGIPGSGKATVLKELADKKGLVYINPDSIRQQLTGDMSDQTRNSEVWELAFAQMASALDLGQSFVLDATNTESMRRRKVVQLIRQHAPEAEIVLWWFGTSFDESSRRNLARDRVVPDHVLKRMWGQLHRDPIDLGAEGFDTLVFQ